MASLFSSLRVRLALSSVGISLAVLALLFSVSYASLGRFLEDSNVATTRHNLQIAMDVLDHEILSLKQLMNWVAVTGPIQNFASTPLSNEETERRLKLAAYDVLHSSLYGSTLYSAMRKFVIVDRHGRSIQMGSVPGDRADARVARETASRGPELLLTDPYTFAPRDTVIALNKVIYGDYSARETAWIQVTLGTEFLTNSLSGYSFENESRMYFLLGSSVLVLGPDRRFRPSDLPATSFHGDQADPGEGGRMWVDEGNQRRLFVAYRAKGTQWILAQSVPRTQFDRQNSVFIVLFAFVVLAMILLVALILFLVDRAVNTPIIRIQRRLAAIARGDFGFEPTIEFRNELGDIGRGINAMSRNIEQLIIRRIQDERAQKDLEFRMLQSQINPHFLYNTLNSIKWMAEIQKARGIAEMVGSLAILLKHVAKGTDELIPLAQELELVKEYCTIQDFRTGGLATLKIVLEDEVAEGRILKFTLQPLVENALQHGIEPTGRPGTIVIHAHREAGDLQVDITDDGVGIPADRLSGIVDREGETHGRSFNPVGLKNVDERLKLRFGPDYGLSVESRWGEFTTVKVRIPWDREAPNPGGNLV